MSLGIYISVPFCRSKCTFCNFASGVFSREKMSLYIERVREEIAASSAVVEKLNAKRDRDVDSIYLGGGTPTTLDPQHLRDLFRAVDENFDVQPSAEITVECAPGTLRPETVQALIDCGVNRASLGTQSFVDDEIRSVGRLHTAGQTLADIACLRQAGIGNLNVDLIAGLPYQTQQSWRLSLAQLSESGVPHASVYMLEVDEDSRLGRELTAGGTRYHAHHVPDSDLIADLYLEAIDFLAGAGLPQYEISNFAKPGCESSHNLKYWTRQSYLGFGLDAHSMLQSEQSSDEFESVRFSNADDLSLYLAGSSRPFVTRVNRRSAAEEQIFLELRLNRGINLSSGSEEQLENFNSEMRGLISLGLIEEAGGRLRLTNRGRLLSNEVFEKFIAAEEVT